MSVQKNIAVIGCGAWGQNHVRSAHEIGVLYAVSDYDMARAQDFAQKYAVKALSFEDVLKDGDIAGIILATPAPLHAKMALEALAAGKHVLVEKPIALSIEDAQKIVTAGEKAGRVVMVGHVLQYHPAFIALKDIIAKGMLGNLRHIASSRLNFGKVRTEENVFWSFAPHDVSMVLAIAGREPIATSAQYHNGLAQSDIASTATVQFDFGGGLSGQIHTSWLNPFKEQKLVVVGDAGMAVFDDTLDWDKKLAFYKNSVSFEKGVPVLNKGDVEYLPVTEAPPLALEIGHFAACMANGERPRTDGKEGLAVLKVMQDADTQALGKHAKAA
jgi:predicted dehydrogenase